MIGITSIVLVSIVAFLVIHHAITHEDHSPFDVNDFKNASKGLFSSHEGLILFVIVFLTGMMIGGSI